MLILVGSDQGEVALGLQNAVGKDKGQSNARIVKSQSVAGHCGAVVCVASFPKSNKFYTSAENDGCVIEWTVSGPFPSNDTSLTFIDEPFPVTSISSSRLPHLPHLIPKLPDNRPKLLYALRNCDYLISTEYKVTITGVFGRKALDSSANIHKAGKLRMAYPAGTAIVVSPVLPSFAFNSQPFFSQTFV